MPADEIEPRFRLEPPEPNPTPRLGVPGPRFPDESVAERVVDEVEPLRPPMRTVTTLAIGTGVGLVLLIGLIFLLHRGGTPTPKPSSAADTASPTAAQQPAGAPSDTAAAPPTAQAVPTSPAPSNSAPPAPTTEAPPVSAAPVPVPAESAPPPVSVKPPAAKPAPAVPQNGPKHIRRTVAAAPWIIQAGAFRTTEHAQGVADGLVKAGYDAVVAKRPNGWFAIELHGYKTKAAADEAAKKLAKTQHIDTLVRRSTADQPVKSGKKSAE